MEKLWLLAFLSGTALAAPPLYSPAPPADSAFVRLINATSNASSAAIDNASLAEQLKPAQVSAYRIFKQGTHVLVSGATKTNLTLEAGGFYTVALLAGHWWVNADRGASSLTQSRLSAYNLSKVDVAIKTSDSKLTVWNKLQPEHYDMMAVNPVKIKLAVNVGKQSLPLPETQLEPNIAYSVIVVGDAKTLRTTWVRNTTEAR
jgi:alginate O-acetyltransferase complex protein AlgF